MRVARLLLAVLSVGGSVAVAAADEERRAIEKPGPVPGFNQRLDDALGSEGGVQVYKDAEGNVGTIIDQPGGTRTVRAQPPQSPSLNLGPPLQQNGRPLLLRPDQAPAGPAAPEFPQKADQVHGSRALQSPGVTIPQPRP